MATKKRRGRPNNPTSKSGKIRALLNSGLSTAEIAKKVGATIALVYNVKARATGGTKKEAGKKRGPGRPRKATAASTGGLSEIIAAVQNSEKERVQMRAALEKIQALIQNALA